MGEIGLFKGREIWFLGIPGCISVFGDVEMRQSGLANGLHPLMKGAGRSV